MNLEENLTPHFKLKEFLYSDTAIARNIDNTPTKEHLENLYYLAEQLEKVRVILGHKQILIKSAYRSHDLNVAVGGVPNSSHALGLACDFTCPGFGTVQEVAQTLADSGLRFDQIIYEQKTYTEWIHIGFDRRMRREILSWKQGRGYVVGVQKL